jgi:hypothetical protein
VDLSAYAAKTIRVAFHFVDDGGDTGYPNYSPTVAAGWSIDDVFVKRENLAITAISDKTVAETNCLTFPVSVVGTTPDSSLSFSLDDGAPAGAMIDPETGVFTWCPSECQGSGTYVIPIYVVDFGNNEANDLGFVRVTVTEVNEPPWLMPASGAAYVGQTNYFTLCSGDPDCPANPLSYSLLGTVPTGLTIDSATGVLRWAPTAGQVGTYTNKVGLCDGGSPDYCVTNTFTVTVTTNAPYFLDVQHVGGGTFQFCILGGQTNVDYVLQQTETLCQCPCQPVWQDVLRVSPTTAPFCFQQSFTNTTLFFRLNQVPRSP